MVMLNVNLNDRILCTLTDKGKEIVEAYDNKVLGALEGTAGSFLMKRPPVGPKLKKGGQRSFQFQLFEFANIFGEHCAHGLDEFVDLDCKVEFSEHQDDEFTTFVAYQALLDDVKRCDAILDEIDNNDERDHQKTLSERLSEMVDLLKRYQSMKIAPPITYDPASK